MTGRVSEEETGDQQAAPRRRRRRPRFAVVLLGVSAVAVAIVWSQREPIARDFVARELEKRGVDARYEIAAIGFRRQRLEKISIGDPANPDLTADWAEVLIRIGLSGPSVTGVRAGGIRLRGRLVDGVFSFGSIDKLLPPPTGKPFTLPELDLDISDARMRLDLPNGPIGLKLDGRGKLTGGFRGKLAAVAPRLDIEGCPLVGATAWLDLSVANRAPRVSGPVRAAAFSCPQAGLYLTAPQTRVNATLNEALNRWKGSAEISAQRAALSGNVLEGVSGTAGFDGGRRSTTGRMRLAAQKAALPFGSGEGLSIDGGYRLGGTRFGFVTALGGEASVAHAALDRTLLAQLSSFGGSGQGTPLGPLAAALAAAVRRAGGDMSARANFTLAQLGGIGSAQLYSLNARSRSGAQMSFAGDSLRFAWPGSGQVQVNGRVALSGGGFPTAAITLAQPAPGAPVTGSAIVAPYAADGARLALTPTRFSASGSGTRFDFGATLDGPLGDGRVTGLTIPIAGRIDSRGGLVVNPGCAPLAFKSLSIAGLALDPARVALCPDGGPALFALAPGGRTTGGAMLRAPRLAGRLGGSPVTLAADSVRYGLAAGALDARNLAIRLGAPESQTRLDIAALGGTVKDGGIAGRFSGTGGQIGNVPLIVSEAAGDWSFAGGALALKGGLRVADSQAEPRFNPLVSDDFSLSLADSRIVAGGLLRVPESRIAVTRVAITHDLSSGKGDAVLDVDDLRFGQSLQPDALTRLAFGVVANVEGSVNGRGTIRWTPEGVTSEGAFRTAGTNLAAAFGPVTDLSGEIRFTDLLGLETAPGQTVTLGEVNPGLPVTNGTVRYRLLAGQRVAIEGGEWPFANGRLVLEPTILDFSAEKPRNLVFRVEGLDAAAFLQAFEFENINATGIFDGTLPMVFDAAGGRIVDGKLVSRQGGSLAYVGELTEKDLGSWGNVAFQALKAIDYRALDITLNGDIAGEMVTQVRFAGLGQGEGAKQNFITRKIASLPIRFNITIRAPFRQLIFSARSFYDPSILIEQNLPALLEAQQAPAQPVQPPESENRP